MSSSKPRIAIVGAGPAGLTLGLLLHNRGVPFTIFELRQKPSKEDLAKPSGSLDLHDESGLAAIRECGLYNEFLPLTGECADGMILSDKNGRTTYSDIGQQADRPEISRHDLTGLLLSHIPADSIKWQHKLVSASSSSTSHHIQTELDFGDNGKHVFDLVIGTDGAWSKVRNLLTDVKPSYAGIQVVTATVRHISQNHADLAEFVGPGTFMALAMKHGVCSQRGVQDSARIYVFISTPDEKYAHTAGFTGISPVAAKDKIIGDKKLLGTWDSKIKDLISAACDAEAVDSPGTDVDIKPLYMLPIGNTWQPKPGVTVVGDAAHLMCPWAGEGVNLAMWDSLLLSRAIIEAYQTGGKDANSFQKALDPLLKEFESEMTTRTSEKAEETFNNGQVMFGDDGAVGMAEFMKSFGPPPEE